LKLVAEVRDEGRTVFLSSHVLSEVQHVADDVVILRAGRVVASGRLEDLRQSARQPFAVWFRDAAPESELAAASGVRELEVRGRQARGSVEGSPDSLLAVLAGHVVEHLQFPEPDLEDAFRRFYTDGER
jgi:ABC-2 type transport system ATP-binding protein